jgi:hypothetical protein
VLRSWIADPAFPSARSKDFARLPPAEHEAWEGLWKDAGKLLADLDELALPRGVTVQRAFSAQSLGVPGPLAGVQFGSDGRTLYLIGSAGFKASSIYALEVERDAATQAITGFGPSRMHARAEHADGGLTQVADGTFYWSTWREHELGELPAKGSAKRFPLAASGVPSGGGGLAFVTAGTSAGALLMSGYADGGIYSVGLSEPIDGTRTPIPDSAKLVARLPKGIEGIRFVPKGPLAGSLLVANWDAGAVSLVDIDRKTGLPVVDAENRASPRNYLGGMVGASGLDFDPVSGALVVSGWGSGNRLVVLAGVGNEPK